MTWPTLPLDDAYAHGVMSVTGESPLLMNSDAHLLGQPTGRKPNPGTRAEAARSAYWMPDRSSLCLHARHLRAAMLDAGDGFRFTDRRPVNPVLKIAIAITPDLIPLGTKQYIAQRQTVREGRQRPVRARALVWPWSATFTVSYRIVSPQFMSTVFREIMERAGMVGVLEHSPKRGGIFGTFKIRSWTLGEARHGAGIGT